MKISKLQTLTKNFISLTICFYAAIANGYVSYFDQKLTEVFTNKKCHLTDSCDLKEVKMKFTKVEVEVTGYSTSNWLTKVTASYKTSSLDKLKDYVFVTFIKGCVFSSRVDDKTGKIEKYYGDKTHQFGKRETFKFRDWNIVSMDSDPAYNSQESYSRHYNYKWDKIIIGLDRKKITYQMYYSDRKPLIPSLYVQNVAGGTAFYNNVRGSAKNISLKLRMCIYKSKDVPTKTVAKNINFAKPIYCYDWDSSYIFDFDFEEFESKTEIDPFCLSGD